MALLAAGLVLVPAAAHSAARAAGGQGAVTSRGPVTVTGPHMYNPVTHKPFPQPSTVTVSQASGLVNELINVSWTNFTPSVPNGAPGPFYQYDSTYYAVMILECKGANPKSWTGCYEYHYNGVPQAYGTDGPPNAAFAITTTKGTGQSPFYVEGSQENTQLGCDTSHPCSLVVFPDQGGDPGPPLDCNDHNQDVIVPNQGTALATNAFNFTPEVGTGACTWKDRIVIPLHFAPAPAGCPQRKPAFSIAGSPMMADAMSPWQTALCSRRHGLTIGYDNQTQEPLAVQEAADGVTDTALTTRPASADGIPTDGRHFVYAPVAVSAASVAYWIDNNTTGQPLAGLRLNPRLLAKLLTTSYNPGIACTTHPKPPQCDPGVDKNPFYIFSDPEFRQLDPTIARAISFFGAGDPWVVPTVQAGRSDMTWTVTRWIGANSGASAFLAGAFDPWGTHVNTYYLGLKYPADQFVPLDPTGLYSRLYNPRFPLSRVVSLQALNQDAGINTPTCASPDHCSYAQDPPQPVGIRRLVAILDQGDAALDHFPVAAIENAAGNYVQPSKTTMAAALEHMISDGNGTLQMNVTDKTKNAYPLTMVIYVMAPTSGLPHAKAQAIARFIDFAAGGGQAQRYLPPGYLPLTAKLRAQARKAAMQVAGQDGGGR